MQNVPQALEKYIATGKLFIFSLKFCPYCDKAKRLFSMINVPYETIEVDQILKIDKEFGKILNTHSGIKTYPKIYIGEKCIGGFSEANDQLKNGNLFKLLEEQKISFKAKL